MFVILWVVANRTPFFQFVNLVNLRAIMAGSFEVRYRLSKLKLAKINTAEAILLMLLLLLVVVVAFPLVIKKEKWNDGTFSG